MSAGDVDGEEHAASRQMQTVRVFIFVATAPPVKVPHPRPTVAAAVWEWVSPSQVCLPDLELSIPWVEVFGAVLSTRTPC